MQVIARSFRSLLWMLDILDHWQRPQAARFTLGPVQQSRVQPIQTGTLLLMGVRAMLDILGQSQHPRSVLFLLAHIRQSPARRILLAAVLQWDALAMLGTQDR